MPTLQETFDAVVNHLRKQGRKAVVPGTTTCVYRTKDPVPLSCAAGCLIPDSEYLPSIEGWPVTDNFRITEAGAVIVKLGHHLGLVASLQRCHDYSDVTEWENEFRRIACLYHLQYSPPA